MVRLGFALRWLGVLCVGIPISGCILSWTRDDPAGQNDAGVSDAGVDQTLPPDAPPPPPDGLLPGCPVTQPSSGEGCSSIGITCEYGDDLRPLCRVLLECTASGWDSCANGNCVPPPPCDPNDPGCDAGCDPSQPGCPPPPPPCDPNDPTCDAGCDPSDPNCVPVNACGPIPSVGCPQTSGNHDCGLTPGLLICEFDAPGSSIQCGCPDCNDPASCSNVAWACSSAAVQGCPAGVAPNIGQPCVQDGLQCEYGLTDLGTYMRRQCMGGIWVDA